MFSAIKQEKTYRQQSIFESVKKMQNQYEFQEAKKTGRTISITIDSDDDNPFPPAQRSNCAKKRLEFNSGLASDSAEGNVILDRDNDDSSEPTNESYCLKRKLSFPLEFASDTEDSLLESQSLRHNNDNLNQSHDHPNPSRGRLLFPLDLNSDGENSIFESQNITESQDQGVLDERPDFIKRKLPFPLDLDTESDEENLQVKTPLEVEPDACSTPMKPLDVNCSMENDLETTIINTPEEVEESLVRGETILAQSLLQNLADKTLESSKNKNNLASSFSHAKIYRSSKNKGHLSYSLSSKTGITKNMENTIDQFIDKKQTNGYKFKKTKVRQETISMESILKVNETIESVVSSKEPEMKNNNIKLVVLLSDVTLMPNKTVSNTCSQLDSNVNTSESVVSPDRNNSTVIAKSLPSTPQKVTPTKKSSVWVRPSGWLSRESKLSLGSPKKETTGMNMGVLKVIQDLFNTVTEAPYLRDLIGENGKKYISDFMAAPPEYQYVCLKLYVYKWKWYNARKFCEKIKVEMSEMEVSVMYKYLSDKGVIDTDFSGEDMAYLMSLLQIHDLKKILERFKLKRSSSKSKHFMGKKEIINLLLENSRTQSTLSFAKSSKDLLFEEVSSRLGVSFRLNSGFRDAFYRTYLLGTFTNPGLMHISDFFNTVLYSNTCFPEFQIENYMVFNGLEFSRYATAKDLNDKLEMAMIEKREIDILSLSNEIFKKLQETADEPFDEERYSDTPHLKRFRAQSVYVSSMTRVVKHCQAKHPEEARDWLEYLIKNINSPHRIGDWYYQLIWLYMRHLKPLNTKHASNLIITVLTDNRENLSERQLYSLSELGEQLKGRKSKSICELDRNKIAALLPEPIDFESFPTTVIDARTVRSNDPGKKRHYIHHDKEGSTTYMNVEETALKYYLNNGYTNGEHCEGSLVRALFTLYFWDLIYNPEKVIPGAFLSKYQMVPLDMYTPYFYRNRQEAIDKRLQDIAVDWNNEFMLDFVGQQWHLHSHEKGLCEAQLYIKKQEDIAVLVTCIGREALSKIFRRLVKNVRQYSSGMPDLLVWNKDAKQAKFVEVKGENDKLSITQKLWIMYLLSQKIDAEVCHVHSTGSKRKYFSKKCEESLASTSFTE